MPATRKGDIWSIPNTLERRSALIVDMLEDQAERMVQAMNEPPPGMQEPDTQQVRAMWTFSPYPNPERTFWAIHDMLLPSLLAQISAQQGMPGDERMKAVRGAHQQAELAALQRVYPQRAKLVMLGTTTIDRSVQLAKRARRLTEQDHQPAPELLTSQEALTY